MTWWIDLKFNTVLGEYEMSPTVKTESKNSEPFESYRLNRQTDGQTDRRTDGRTTGKHKVAFQEAT